MPLYSYKALDLQGKINQGKTHCQDKKHLYLTLKHQGLSLIRARKIFSSFQRSISSSVLADLCLHLGHLDQAGVPLAVAISDLAHSMNHRKLQEILLHLHEDLIKGTLLSQALAKYPKIFDTLFIQLIAVGEKTGKFYPYLAQLEHYFRWKEAIEQKAKKSLIYPALLFAILGVLTALVFGFIVPNLEKYLTSLGVSTLPLATSILLGTATFLSDYSPIIFTFLGGIFLSLVLIHYFSSKGKEFLSHLQTKVPFFGNVRIQQDLLNFLQTFSVMIGAGVDLLVALDQSIQAVKNVWLKRRLSCTEGKLIQGSPLSDALATTVPNLSPYIFRVIQLGETTGNLAPLLAQVCDYQMKDLWRRVERLVAWIEPTLVIIMGLMMIWIVSAIMTPLYDSIGAVDW